MVTSGNYYSTLKKYSGLIYGYNQHGVFVWRVIPTSLSFFFDIDFPWGSGEEQQQTNDVEINIHVFGLMSRGW